jgi:hypothetical protein
VVRPPSVELDEGLLFDQRLQLARRQQGSLLLVTELEQYLEVRRRLVSAFAATFVDMDAVLLEALHAECAARGGIKWNVVLATDEQGPTSPNWIKLQQLIAAALIRVQDCVMSTPGLVLLGNVGLLGRYQRLTFLSQLQEALPSRPVRPEALWILIPSNRQNLLPTLHGEAVPVPPSGTCRIPEAWLARAA